MATTLTGANTAAAAARASGQTTLDPQVLATIRNHYRGALALGIHTSSARAGHITGWYVQSHPHSSASTAGYGARSWLARTSQSPSRTKIRYSNRNQTPHDHAYR